MMMIINEEEKEREKFDDETKSDVENIEELGCDVTTIT